MLQFLAALGAVILVDLTLSGDNALVIGAAASGLPQSQRLRAIVLGGAGAIVLRIAFASAATLLLELPFLQAVGGLVLFFIAARLLAERRGSNEEQVEEEAKLIPDPDEDGSHKPPSRTFTSALLTILVADVTMSLDNILAIGALAHGELVVLGLGLLLSITLVLAGSALIASLIQRLPWLLDLAALVLGYTAAGMLLHDLRLGPVLHDGLPYADVVIYTLGVGIVLVVDVVFRVRERKRLAKSGGA